MPQLGVVVEVLMEVLCDHIFFLVCFDSQQSLHCASRVRVQGAASFNNEDDRKTDTMLSALHITAYALLTTSLKILQLS